MGVGREGSGVSGNIVSFSIERSLGRDKRVDRGYVLTNETYPLDRKSLTNGLRSSFVFHLLYYLLTSFTYTPFPVVSPDVFTLS